MTFQPILRATDDRSGDGLPAVRLTNAMMEPAPEGSRSLWRVKPVPGLRTFATLPGPVRAVYSMDGVAGGDVLAIAGSAACRVSEAGVVTTLGTVTDTGRAEITGLRDRPFFCTGGRLWQWTGTALEEIADPDLDDDPLQGVASLDLRVIAFGQSDTFYWSQVLNGSSWPSLAFATAERRPDKLLRVLEVGGQLYMLGAKSIEVLRGTGSDDLAFQNVSQAVLEVGVLAPGAATRLTDTLLLIGSDLVPYEMQGLSTQPRRHRELSLALQALTLAERAQVEAWTYDDAGHQLAVFSLPRGHSYVFDAATNEWHRRITQTLGRYRAYRGVQAWGRTFAADIGGSVLYELDARHYLDDGAPLRCETSLRLETPLRTPLNRVAVDFRAWRGDPAQAVRVGLRLSRSLDLDVDDVPSRWASAGTVGQRLTPNFTRLGMVRPSQGATLTFDVTDPVGWWMQGAWINPRDAV